MLYQPWCHSQRGLHLYQAWPKCLNGIRLFFPRVFVLPIKTKPKGCGVSLVYFPEQHRVCKPGSEIVAIQKSASNQKLKWDWIHMQRGGFHCPTRYCPIFMGLGSAESRLKVGMAPMYGNNLYRRTALCNFPIRVLSSRANSQPFTSCKFQEGLSLHCQSGEASWNSAEVLKKKKRKIQQSSPEAAE